MMDADFGNQVATALRRERYLVPGEGIAPNRRGALILAVLWVAFTLVAAAPSPAIAAPVTLPPGLSLGDEYRFVFVTSAFRNATSPDISDYDAFVTSAAEAVPELAALGTTWSAIGSTTSVTARDHTSTNPTVDAGVPVYLLDGSLMAADNIDLWDGSLLASPSIDENGDTVISGSVWTGSSHLGIAPVGLELGSGMSTQDEVLYGLAYATDSFWMQFNVNTPLASYHVYGMSDVITAVPEPSTVLLLSLGLTGLAVLRSRTR